MLWLTHLTPLAKTLKGHLSMEVFTIAPAVLLVHIHIMFTRLPTVIHSSLHSWITLIVDANQGLLMDISTSLINRLHLDLSLLWHIRHRHCYYDLFSHNICNSIR